MMQATISRRFVFGLSAAFLVTAALAARGASPQPFPSPATAEVTPSTKAATVDPVSDDVAPSPSQPQEADPDVQPASFSGAQPGTTTPAALKKAWGDPVRTAQTEDGTILTYRIKPFRQVDVTVAGGVVASIVVHLAKPLEPDHVARQLTLDRVAHVPVSNQVGELLGWAYPERGVLFSFSPDAEAPQVAQILIETISAESFVLRAEEEHQHRYERSLADLDYAIRLDADNARAHWLKAELLAALDRPDEALSSASEAVRLEGTSAAYRLTWARLLGETGQYDKALEQTRKVLAAENLVGEVKARAECQLGDLLARGSLRRNKEALEHHMGAIRLAMAPASDRRIAVRRAAKRVLIDAHLAVAQDIAEGDWRRKNEVVPKWLARAGKLIEAAIASGDGDSTLRLLLYRKTLEAYARLPDPPDPSETMESMLQLGRRLIAEGKDPLFQRRTEWELGEALVLALRIERDRDQSESALRYAESAATLFQEAVKGRPATPDQQYLRGRLDFLIGSIYAVQKGDHGKAVAWYDSAADLIWRSQARSAEADLGSRGEWLVSMGLSYWETGAKDRGLELTGQGIDLIRQAVEKKMIDASTLVIPYNNLASMHEERNEPEKAKQFAEMAAKIERVGEGVQRR